MRTRHGVHPDRANEALNDPDRLLIDPDPASTSGRGLRTLGWSPSAGRILTVITLIDDERLYGVTGWVASGSDQRLYREEHRGE